MFNRRRKPRERLANLAKLALLLVKKAAPYAFIIAALFGAPVVIVLVLQLIGGLLR